jgi:diacylglycerol diphosphate phosphatase/phosphatidate phosphatase
LLPSTDTKARQLRQLFHRAIERNSQRSMAIQLGRKIGSLVPPHTLPEGRSHLPWYQRYRLIDWLVCLGIILFIVILGLTAPTYCQSFRWDDSALQQPSVTPQFPTELLIPFFVVPVLAYALACYKWPIGLDGMTRFDEFVYLCLMQLRGYAFSALITEPLKLFVGGLRPDFIARLVADGIQPPADLSTRETLCDVYSGSIFDGGRQTFPSGHAASLFASMVTFSLFLVHRLGTFRYHRGSTAHLLVSVPWIVAATVASFGRVREGRHFPVDCVAGVFAGVFMAMMTYKMTFEPVPAHQVNATHADDKFRTPVEPTLPMNRPESSREQEPSAADRNNVAPLAAPPPSGHAVDVDADSDNGSTHSGAPLLPSSPSSSRSRERTRPRSSHARPSSKKRASRTPTGDAKG